MKLRVAHIITKLELGGAQQNTIYTASHLNRERYDACVISGREGILDSEAVASCPVVYFSDHLVRPINPYHDLMAVIELYRLLRQIRPHIVHTHSSKAGILGRIAGYLAGVPVIVHTYHGFGFTPGQNKFVRKTLIAIERFCALLTTHLIFVSLENQRQAAALGIGPKKPWSLIRSGIALKEGFPGAVRQELRIPQDAWVVISVGNFKPQKNPMDLVRAAGRAMEKRPGMIFLLVGDGELRPAAETWVKNNNLEKNIRFLGWRRDVSELLAAANAFLLTSLWEGLPRSIAEAFVNRLPTVAYAVDGVKEVVLDGENGFLIPSGNIIMAAEKILWLEEHRDKARAMGEKGKALIQKEFDINDMVRRQETLYDTLVEAVPLKNYYLP
jgi:glycosyltransferase involved in cell wall biosynthesis